MNAEILKFVKTGIFYLNFCNIDFRNSYNGLERINFTKIE